MKMNGCAHAILRLQMQPAIHSLFCFSLPKAVARIAFESAVRRMATRPASDTAPPQQELAFNKSGLLANE